MNTISRPNRDALQKALDIYRDAMRPFLVRCLRQVRGMNVEDVINRSLGNRRADEFERALTRSTGNVESAIDINDFPTLVSRNWHRETFETKLNGDKTFQNQLWLITDARNHTVHAGTQDLDDDYTRTHLFLIANVLEKIGASDGKQVVQSIRDELFSDPIALSTTASQSEEGLPESEESASLPKPSTSKLAAWRDVIRPNLDVAQGNFREADFAADLQQVHNERASAAGYGNPVSFFKQTYITPGIRTLLVNTLQRLGGNGGHPVIQTKTGFGGGKTHSLIALYHLVTSADALINPPTDGEHDQISKDIRAIMQEAGWDPDADVHPKIAVLGGTYFSTTDSTVTETGDPLNTLWGIMAHQLGGQEAYELVGQASRQGTAPGGAQLDQLFKHVGPCVILMDELVAYVRNAGSAKDSIYTFLQALTESVRRSKNVALVVTLPEGQVEAGDEAGAEALNRLDRLFGRIEAIWKPLEVHEAFEVVRRRLFENDIENDIEAQRKRDETCEAFARMYSRSRRDYPQGVSEQRYIERMKACYPIHPEIFDRLYHDWSTIPRFQRTRGVLRIMANCISHLDQNRDESPLIMPANLPLSYQTLAEEFIGLLTDQWNAVITEVDSDNSLTYQMDGGSEPFRRVGGAARRIARTVFLGSCPDRATKGIDARHIRLGVVEPNHGIPVYNDALSQMRGNLYYFYSDNDRYYFHVEENLNKVAANRADALTETDIHAEIVNQIETAVGRRSDVIISPENAAQIPDSDKIKLVILPPDKTLNSRTRDSDEATPMAEQFFRFCGDETDPRRYRNTILFLAAKREDMNTLKRAISPYLAWHSIINGDRRIPNLKGDRRRQATASLTNAERELASALVKAYRWALAPTQPNPTQNEYQWTQFMTDAEQNGKIVESAFSGFLKEEVLIEKISPATLAQTLKEYVWDNPSYEDHIKIEDLWDLLARHVYLPRLKNMGVLLACIKQGVPENAFGYAESYADSELRENKDEQHGSYTGIRFGEDLGFATIDGTSLLVNPDKVPTVPQEDDSMPPDPEETPHVKPEPGESPQTQPRGPVHFVATKTMQGEISLDDINLLREEIIRTMQNDGGEISVTVTIEARNPDGFSENAARSIRQNSESLNVALQEKTEN